MITICRSLPETQDLARAIADNAQLGDVFALTGELGSGKTTIVQTALAELGVKDRVLSPTFVLMREYLSPRFQKQVFHLDLYRLESAEEVLDLGLMEIIDSGQAIVFIEWPELIKDYLPPQTHWIDIQILDGERQISLRQYET